MPQTTNRHTQRPEHAMVVRDRHGMRRVLGAVSAVATRRDRGSQPRRLVSTGHRERRFARVAQARESGSSGAALAANCQKTVAECEYPAHCNRQEVRPDG